MTAWLFEPGIDGSVVTDALDITLRFEGDVTVCVLDGALGARTATTLDSWLGQLQVNGRRRVIVDAAAVDVLTSDGVEVLAAHAARLRAADGALQIRAPSAVVLQVLVRSGAGHLVNDAAAS